MVQISQEGPCRVMKGYRKAGEGKDRVRRGTRKSQERVEGESIGSPERVNRGTRVKRGPDSQQRIQIDSGESSERVRSGSNYSPERLHRVSKGSRENIKRVQRE